MKKKSKLNRIDFELLGALQNDARLSNKELAARVGLAPSTCLERVRRLHAIGALRGFHASVDPHVLGVGLQAMLSIRIRRHSRELIEQFHAHALALEEVIALYHLGGINDFLVHVAVRDADHLRTVVLDAFTTRPEVEHLETAFVFGFDTKPALPNYAVEE